jgi:aldehyde:ferredoxin oxidoreductase
MSRCGFDAIILEGASDSPVYLEVTPSGVIFHDARSLRGKGTYETEDTILREVNAKGARAIVIGPAGENLVKYAVVENEKWRSAGRTGVGAVLGSKKSRGLLSTAINDVCSLMQREQRRLPGRFFKNTRIRHQCKPFGTTALRLWLGS